MPLSFPDHRNDPEGWAKDLGVSREAVELYLASDVLDLHVDTFIWHRIFGYDIGKRHGHGLFGARFYSQVDLPRLREARITGATWVITTNPFRHKADRAATFAENLADIRRLLGSFSDDVRIVKNVAEYEAAKADGRHAAFLGVQGGNAVDKDVGAIDLLDDSILRVTLVHLSTSSLGTTSSPAASAVSTGDGGLTPAGKAYVEALNAKNIFVDLAHISRKGFFDALTVHDRSKAPIVTHTGIDAVWPHWRNLTDEQVRAIADRGGTIGIMYQSSFLGPSAWGGKLSWIVDHMDHVRKLVGDDFVSLGSDWDGAIVPPKDMPTVLELPRLVDEMLRRGWSTSAVQKALGGNALRTIRSLKG